MNEDELQTNSDELETAESGEDSAPSTEEQQPEKVDVPEGYIKAEHAQKDINRQHKKFRDEERARKQIEADYERTQRELAELRTKVETVEVPPPPDPYSENYVAEVAARDEALQRKTQHDAQLALAEKEQQRAEQARIERENEQIEQRIASFDSNMVTLGLNPLEVKKAADTVIEFGASDLIQDVILEDPEGPLITQYLANNPVELDQLNGMSALQLVRHIDEKVRPQASLLRPKTSKAPDPPETLSGGGVKELEDPLLEGAQFE